MEVTSEPGGFRVIAHRGASSVCPENTMAAFEGAIAAGADMIELDLTLCASGEFVVIHDEVLDRTTDGKGLVSDWNLEHLRKLDAGKWFGPEFEGELIPEVEQVLDKIAPRIALNIEIKPLFALEQRGMFISALQRLLGELDARAMHGRVMLSSFNLYVLRWLRQQDKRLRMAFLYNKSAMSVDPVWACETVGAVACNPNHRRVTPELCKRLRGANIACYPYTVNSRERMDELSALGVDGIITDFPARFVTDHGRQENSRNNG